MSEEELEQAENKPNELSQPPVIDLEALLQPISEETPSGEYLRYDGVYDEIGEARRADDTLDRGDWQEELKVADFRKVIELAVPVLEKTTKDLQIAAWLSEAIVKEFGFAGLRDSMKMLNGMQNGFWETLFPEIDEGDMEGRANALAWFDNEAAFSIKQAPITSGEGYSFFGWEDSKKFNIPDDLDMLDTTERQKFEALKEQAKKENRPTAEKWKQATTLSKRAFYEELDVIIEECWEEYKKLNLIIEEKFDPKQAPGLGNLKKALDAIQTQTNKLLEQKRIEEPDPIEEIEEEIGIGDGETVGSQKSGMTTAKGAINSRKDALRRLSELASYFRKTEPHSPVSYLISRAVKWGEMPLESWLQDVIKDENILYQLRQTLGFNTAGDNEETTDSTAVTDPTAVVDPTAV